MQDSPAYNYLGYTQESNPMKLTPSRNYHT